MLAKVQSCAVIGLDALPVQVEVDITNGLEKITVVGLPDAAVRESSERVRSAIANSGLFYPNHRLTVNLAPADLRKVGPAYDLPIAVGILAAARQLLTDLDDALIVGELSLDGEVRHVSGVLPLADLARQNGWKRVYVPAVDAPEAALVDGVAVYPVETLQGLIQHLNGIAPIQPLDHIDGFAYTDEVVYPVDFADIKGQEHVKRALEVSCAGSHNVLMKGPPGAGKTLLARALPSILPGLDFEESLEITRICSVANALPDGEPLVRSRPFRAPHHTISHAGLVGGGAWPRPGEISLAHRGVLFLDELPEFSSKSLEALRQPLEDHIVTISRAQGALTFPANFILIGAMNPCPCGYYGDESHPCTCSMSAIQRYQKRISGPLLDRIDIHVDVKRVPYDKLTAMEGGETSASIRRRIESARERQLARFTPLEKDGLLFNGDMGPAEVQEYCALDETGANLMRSAVKQMDLSARAYHRVLKLARTIADIAGEEAIKPAHLAEALQYRPRTLQ